MRSYVMPELSGGVNFYDRPDCLEPGQAAQGCNVWYHRGCLRARPGQQTLSDWGLEAAVDTMCYDEQGAWYIQSGGKLYRRRDGQTQLLYTLETGDSVGSFVPHANESVYFINGQEFLRIDGDTVTAVEPYIPLHLYTEQYQSGSGAVVKERPNLLTSLIRVQFRLNEGSATNYLELPQECKSGVKPSRVVCDGKVLTVSSVSGRRVNLSSTISVSNVIIEVTTQLDGWEETDVTACRQAVMFGPESRLLLCCNGSNRYYVSGPFDPSYFPDSGQHAFGSGDPITGIGKLYDLLVLFKARELAQIRSAEGYRAGMLSPTAGCDMPGSICTVGNRLVWASTWGGVQMLVSTSSVSERNVRNLSRNVDPLLLSEDETLLREASACDWEGHYLLCVGDRVYVWDYRTRGYSGADEAQASRRLCWYVWEGIDARVWMPQEGKLCYLRRSTGEVAALGASDGDFGEPFRLSWSSAAFCPGDSERYFHADELILRVPREKDCSFCVEVCCDEREENELRERGIVQTTVSSTGHRTSVPIPVRLRDAQTMTVGLHSTDPGFALQRIGLYWREGGAIRLG